MILYEPDVTAVTDIRPPIGYPADIALLEMKQSHGETAISTGLEHKG
jgi:hypothetical protein